MVDIGESDVVPIGSSGGMIVSSCSTHVVVSFSGVVRRDRPAVDTASDPDGEPPWRLEARMRARWDISNCRAAAHASPMGEAQEGQGARGTSRGADRLDTSTSSAVALMSSVRTNWPQHNSIIGCEPAGPETGAARTAIPDHGRDGGLCRSSTHAQARRGYRGPWPAAQPVRRR